MCVMRQQKELAIPYIGQLSWLDLVERVYKVILSAKMERACSFSDSEL
jgi:hypothetical protein